MEASEFVPTSDEVLECPFPFYEAVRRTSPAYELPGGGTFLLTRYDDVVAATRNPDLFSNHRPPIIGDDPTLAAVAAEGWPEVATLSTTDPPDHGRYRKLVNRSFTPRAVAELEPGIRVIVDALIDDFIDDGRVELVTQFANLMPAYVIADALGVPRQDHLRFKRWSDDLIHLVFAPLSRQRHLECLRSYVEMQHYFAERIEQRRVAPGADLVSHLVTSRVDAERPLNVPEILDLVRQFLVAGTETTASLIESAMLLLLDHPDVLEEVSHDRSLIAPMLEEAVRLASPAEWNPRTVMDTANVDDVEIPAGARLRLAWAAANRDPTYVPDPDRFDIHRDHTAQIAYGHGIHFCLGAWLARTEARLAFETILQRLTHIHLAVPRSDVRYVPRTKVRRLNHLPLRFEEAR